MNFEPTPLQQMIDELASQVLKGEVTEDGLAVLEAAQTWTHRAAYEALAKAELLSVALPEPKGGLGGGLLEICTLLTHVGAQVAPVPVFETLVQGVLPVLRYGTPDLVQRVLQGVAVGDRIFTGALSEPDRLDPLSVTTKAESTSLGWKLRGCKGFVAYADIADFAVVSAQTDDGLALFVVDLSGPGVELSRNVTTNGQPVFTVTFDGAQGEHLGGAEAVRWTVGVSRVGLSALTLGIARRALELTATYASSREQFGQAIGLFQAVSQRLADAYIDLQAMEVSMWQAAWRLSEGLDFEPSVAIARYWACCGGHRIVATAQHVHAGMGFDRDYPLHRYFLWFKRVEFVLGGASIQLAELGEMIHTDVGRLD